LSASSWGYLGAVFEDDRRATLQVEGYDVAGSYMEVDVDARTGAIRKRR
jgi:hypothetical protein